MTKKIYTNLLFQHNNLIYSYYDKQILRIFIRKTDI